MAKKNKSMLCGETVKITLPYDGDKYKDPVYVGINGQNWVIERGEEVEIPVEVYEVLKSSEKQDRSRFNMLAKLAKEDTDLGTM